MTAKALAFLFPNRKIPAGMSNPVLSGFTNAILHCATAAEVTRVLNTAIKEAERNSGRSIDDLPVSPL